MHKESLSENGKQQMKREVQVLRHMDHPSIVRIYETFQDKDSFYLVTEIVTGGELFDEIVNRNNFNEKDAATLMK